MATNEENSKNGILGLDELPVHSGVKFENTCLCSPCESNDKYRKATKYCQNCLEYFCSDCLKQHNQFRLMRNHVVTDVSGGGNVTEAEQEDRPKCTIHAKFITMYCKQHNEICCEFCDAFKHGTCLDKTDIRKAANDVKNSSEYKTKEDSLSSVVLSLEALKKDISGKLEQLDVGKEQSLSKVDHYRKELIATVNKLADESRRCIERCYHKKKARKQSDMNDADLAVITVTETLEELRSENNISAFIRLRSCSSVLQECKNFLNAAKSREQEQEDYDVDPSLLEGLASRQCYFYQEDNDRDLIITAVERCTEEEIQKARELALPDHFFMYKKKPPCPGCRGCNDEVPSWESIPAGVQPSPGIKQPSAERNEEDDDDEYDDDGSEGEKEYSQAAAGLVFGAGAGNFTFTSLATSGGSSRFKTDENIKGTRGSTIGETASNFPSASLPASIGTNSVYGMFKPKAGTWTCNSCDIQNDDSVLKCCFCSTLKPGIKKKDQSAPGSTTFTCFGTPSRASSGFFSTSETTSRASGSSGFTTSAPGSKPITLFGTPSHASSGLFSTSETVIGASEFPGFTTYAPRSTRVTLPDIPSRASSGLFSTTETTSRASGSSGFTTSAPGSTPVALFGTPSRASSGLFSTTATTSRASGSSGTGLIFTTSAPGSTPFHLFGTPSRTSSGLFSTSETVIGASEFPGFTTYAPRSTRVTLPDIPSRASSGLFSTTETTSRASGFSGFTTSAPGSTPVTLPCTQSRASSGLFSTSVTTSRVSGSSSFTTSAPGSTPFALFGTPSRASSGLFSTSETISGASEFSGFTTYAPRSTRVTLPDTPSCASSGLFSTTATTSGASGSSGTGFLSTASATRSQSPFFWH